MSIFFVLETITTVGYGDFTGGTTYERIFTMFLEVINYSLMNKYSLWD